MKTSGEQSRTKRLLSGIQPSSGKLHIGNYLGAIKNWIKLQNKYGCFFFIADMHAITIPQDPKELKNNIRQLLAIYLACGIDPKQSTIFLQSDIPEHGELAWILTCQTKMGELTRMTQFKDKSQGTKSEGVGAGLFVYPALMAADILLYQTDLVPVGEDQTQHVEIARDLARKFNNRFGNILKLPQAEINPTLKRIMALDNPETKMAKSAKSEYNYIAIMDSDEDIKKKISRAVTDSEKTIRFDSEKRKGLANLLNIYSGFSDKSVDEIIDMYKNKGYKEFKSDLSDLLIEKLSPIRNKTNELLESSELDKILKNGKEFAQAEAEKTLIKVKKAVGLGL
ncbi:MAG: tryptophan--tRNA ligase [bacterium]